MGAWYNHMKINALGAPNAWVRKDDFFARFVFEAKVYHLDGVVRADVRCPGCEDKLNSGRIYIMKKKIA